MACNTPTAGGVPLSRIEEMMELEPSAGNEKDHFRSKNELWHPPGGRGVYGGILIGQSIVAAQRTVPDDFYVHALSCYFLLAGDSKVKLDYSVSRARDGKNFATRIVTVGQNNKTIFTVTFSFARKASGQHEQLQHAHTKPPSSQPPPEDNIDHGLARLGAPQMYPDSLGNKANLPQDQRLRFWFRSPSKISEPKTHLAILGYLSDWTFLPTVPLIHGKWRYPEAVSANAYSSPLDDSEIGMMATIHHTIVVHDPSKIKADEWMFFDSESPWSGEGRGLVTGRIFHKEGILLATCYQEGVIRRRKEPDAKELKL